MMQKMFTTALTPLQNVDEINCLENRPFNFVWPDFNRDKSTNIKKPIMKKAKRVRTAYTTEQLRALEMWFKQNKYITSERRREISKALNIGDKSVKIWFQNRRMKEKRKTSESSSDSSNETFVCEMSPPPMTPTLPTKIPNSNQIIGIITNEVTNEGTKLVSTESCQYQIPPCFNNTNEQLQTSHAFESNIIQSNNMQFNMDSNIYPTQYYPCNEVYHYNGYNYNQYQQENAMFEYNNYWSLYNGESGYLYK